MRKIKMFCIVLIPIATVLLSAQTQQQSPEKQQQPGQAPAEILASTQAITITTVARGTIENPQVVPIFTEIPPNTLIQSVTMEAKNWFDPDTAYRLCPEIGGCPIGWCAWVGKYSVKDETNRRVITTTFKNWSHNWDRTVRVTVTYTLNLDLGKVNLK